MKGTSGGGGESVSATLTSQGELGPTDSLSVEQAVHNTQGTHIFITSDENAF